MNILTIGDIVGRAGVETVEAQLKYLKQDYAIDFVIANGENSKGTNGINKERADRLIEAGVDIITTGNHTFDKKEVAELFENNYPIIRPYNYSSATPGKGYIIKACCGKKIAVINLLGRVYLSLANDPFEALESIIKEIEAEADILIVDFHAEATSEKAALAWYFDGRITAMFGTHTHVQTADERLLPKGTAFITDIGMTGPFNSILGVDVNSAVKRFLSPLPIRLEAAKGNTQLNAAVFEINDATNQVKSIKRINIK